MYCVTFGKHQRHSDGSSIYQKASSFIRRNCKKRSGWFSTQHHTDWRTTENHFSNTCFVQMSYMLAWRSSEMNRQKELTFILKEPKIGSLATAPPGGLEARGGNVVGDLN